LEGVTPLQKGLIMRIKFVEGYRGVLTKEKYYPPDSVANLKKEIAELLIARGRAVPYQKEVKAAEDA